MTKPARVKLSPKLVAEAKPGPKPYEIHDAAQPGLILRVQPSGVKSYVVTWGRGKRRTLGRHPVLTLAGARTRALRALAEAADHGAPLAVLARTAGPVTFGEFMAEYADFVTATAKAGAATVAAIKAVFGSWYGKRLDAIRLEDWDTLRAARLGAGVTPATVNRDLDRIKAALQQAVEWGRLQSNPLAKAKRTKRDVEQRVRYLTPKEAKALRNALDRRERRRQARRLSGDAWRQARRREPLGAFEGYTDHLAPMVLLALNTGCRRGELTQLTWADVDLRTKVLTVRAGYAKSGKARHIPLNREALDVLKRWRKTHSGEGRLFPVAQINKAWAALVADAGIEDFRFHDLRHDFASQLVMRGVPLIVVRDLLGHGSIEMTERYAHLAPHRAAEAVALLG